MSYDAALAQRVHELLPAAEGVTERRMMGALCFMVGGHMCCGVTGSELMVRVGRDAYADVLSEPHVKPMLIGARATTGFVLVDASGIQSNTDLIQWIQRGIEFASLLPRKATARPRRSVS